VRPLRVSLTTSLAAASARQGSLAFCTLKLHWPIPLEIKARNERGLVHERVFIKNTCGSGGELDA